MLRSQGGSDVIDDALPSVRARRRLTIDVLAERASVAAFTLRRLERGGVPTYRTGARVARALRVRPGNLSAAVLSVECPDCEERINDILSQLAGAPRAGAAAAVDH